MFSSDIRLSKNSKIPWRLIEGEALLIDGEEGELIRLNQVGSEIWEAIDGRRTIVEITTHIVERFDVSERRASKDVQRFIKLLLRHELVAPNEVTNTR